MKINYGRENLCTVHETLVDCFNGAVRRDITAELACNAFLVEAYELEVTKHGGLDAEKIEEYKALCREFLDFVGETM